MRKLTTQEFIDRARTVHGDRYDYRLVNYSNNTTPVDILCEIHGVFKQKPAHHLVHKGCRKCSDERNAVVRTKDTKSFIERAKEIHGNKYRYALSVYQKALIKVIIYCPIHGTFEQTPANHLSGQECPECGEIKRAKTYMDDTDSFIAKARAIHGNTYGYDQVEYTGVVNKIKITCKIHGSFEQWPSDHISNRSGCPGCASYGFDRTRSASLYVLRSDCGRYMKIGITHNPKQRYNKLKRDTPFSFKRIELIEGPGEQIANLEKELLAEYQPAEFTETFDGYSEWRLWDDSIRHKLISFMNKELTNGPV